MFGFDPVVCVIALVLFIAGMVAGVYYANMKKTVDSNDAIPMAHKVTTYKDDGSVDQVTYKDGGY